MIDDLEKDIILPLAAEEAGEGNGVIIQQVTCDGGHQSYHQRKENDNEDDEDDDEMSYPQQQPPSALKERSRTKKGVESKAAPRPLSLSSSCVCGAAEGMPPRLVSLSDPIR